MSQSIESNAQVVDPHKNNQPTRSQQAYNLQRAAFLEAPYPDYQERYQNLLKLENLLRDNQDAIAEAISKDFGNRCKHETQILELFSCIDGIKDTRKKLKKWMKTQKRHVSIWFFGAQNTVLAQPKGVVGVVTPWNYPLLLSFGPLTNALAAGNRCMVKMAANSRHTCALLAELVSNTFDPKTLTILPEVSATEFTDIPYDHLIFTGSPAVGKQVMAKAAQFLTPVTLELGGKSPTIVAQDYDIDSAAEQILQGKLYNAGQTCVAPDYIFVPESKVDTFVASAKKAAAKLYPDMASEHLTSIIDDRAYNRLCDTLEDASDKGAQVVNLLNGQQTSSDIRKISPQLVLGVDNTMTIMQEEIFGPLLPIKPYKSIDEALSFINQGERPLALYLFSNSKKTQGHVIKNTLSGGVCLNAVMMHVVQHDMPFGGIGNSGMGHYHGYEGFIEFSKLRPIFKQAMIPSTQFLAAPYGKLTEFLIKLMTR